jgi:hypothetical protein
VDGRRVHLDQDSRTAEDSITRAGPPAGASRAPAEAAEPTQALVVAVPPGPLAEAAEQAGAPAEAALLTGPSPPPLSPPALAERAVVGLVPAAEQRPSRHARCGTGG